MLLEVMRPARAGRSLGNAAGAQGDRASRPNLNLNSTSNRRAKLSGTMSRRSPVALAANLLLVSSSKWPRSCFLHLLIGPTRTVENGANFLCENLVRQRLLHQLDTGIEAPIMN